MVDGVVQMRWIFVQPFDFSQEGSREDFRPVILLGVGPGFVDMESVEFLPLGGVETIEEVLESGSAGEGERACGPEDEVGFFVGLSACS